MSTMMVRAEIKGEAPSLLGEGVGSGVGVGVVGVVVVVVVVVFP